MFGKEIESDEYHAVNYIIQATAAEIFLRQFVKIHNLLEGRLSHLAFCIHDSLVIDLSEKDMDILLKLKKSFSETDTGNFLVNVNVGKNFGDMKKLAI